MPAELSCVFRCRPYECGATFETSDKSFPEQKAEMSIKANARQSYRKMIRWKQKKR